MKVALVHELLTMKGGAENVLHILSEMFPDAPIFTLLYDEKKMGDRFPKEKIRTPHYPTPYALLPSPLRYNHHLYLSQFPRAIESFDFSEFDLVISSSSAFAHGIITNGKPKHLCYVHSPARYLWDRTHDVLEQAEKGLLGPLRRWHLSRVFHKLRIWDAEVAPRADTLLAASKEVQRRIELYWREPSEVVYPPIDDAWLNRAPSSNSQLPTPYALIVSTLARYKRIDLAIEACNTLSMHLKIVGEGPDRRRLERMAGPTIEFYGFREQDELRDLLSNADVVLFPGDEDFGLVPLEAMACGTPVLAYRSGGALETIIEGVTGKFFDEPTAESLAQALVQMQKKSYDKEACKAQVQKFSRAQFEENIKNAIAILMR